MTITKSLINALQQPVLLVDEQGVVKCVSAKVQQTLGISNGELDKLRLSAITSHTPEQLQEKMKLWLSSGSPVPVRIDFLVNTSAEPVSLTCYGQRLVLTDNAATERKMVLLQLKQKQEVSKNFLALNDKITELEQEVARRKVAEKDLQESERYNRMLFETSTTGLVLCGMDGELVDINPAYASIIGRSIDESKQLTYWILPPTIMSKKK